MHILCIFVHINAYFVHICAYKCIFFLHTNAYLTPVIWNGVIAELAKEIAWDAVVAGSNPTSANIRNVSALVVSHWNAVP